MKKQVVVLGAILAVWGGLYVAEKGVLKGDISQNQAHVVTSENYCVGERLAKINLLSQQAENCQIDMTGKSESTEMMSVYFEGVECLKKVAYRIFDDYYDHYRDEVRQNFDAYVEKARQLTVSMKKQSEIARVNQTALFYDLEAETNWYFMVREAVFEYLKAMREECQSYDETA